MKFTRGWLLSLTVAGVLGGWMLAGCSAPPAKAVIRIKPDGSLQAYRKVHILPPPADYRHIQVKLLTRLRALGFEADIIDPKKGLDRSQGTGFLVSPEGHLLTCAHVVGQNAKATVWLAGAKYEALVLRRDADSDLALLKLNVTTNLSPAPIARSLATNLALGQDVFTIGYPLSDILGSAPRLTKGLVSATVGLHDDPNHVQISAEIQPGNSGGPLLNSKGEFVGMVSSTLNPMNVLARTGGNLPQNVNFAIKGAVIQSFLKQAGVTPAAGREGGDPISFDTVKNSVAHVRGGVRTRAEEEQPEMLCRVAYASVSPVELRFRYFLIEFRDLKSGKELFRTGLLRDSRDNSEDAVLNRAIEDVRKNFFPATSPSRK